MTRSAVVLRVLNAQDWRLFREVRLWALTEAPDAFSSTLADWSGERDTEQRWLQRITDVPFNLVAYFDDEPAGMVSATEPDDDRTSELISMWVAPPARGKGVGEALINAVVAWASDRGIRHVSLSVREDNDYARVLYARLGFEDRGPIELESDEPPERRMIRSITP